MFIWLGAGRARRFHVGPPSSLLDQAAQAGLPVPAGAVLLDTFFRFALTSGLAQANGHGVVIPDAELWHNTLHLSAHLPRFRRPVNVYAAAGAEPATMLTIAIRSGIEFNDPQSAAQAIEAVWSSAADNEPPRRDALIVETVAATTAGAATTVVGQPSDQIALSHAPDAPFALPQLSSRRRPDPGQPPYARRLQQLLRGARRTFGPGAWRIAWADDGQICWLLLAARCAPPG